MVGSDLADDSTSSAPAAPVSPGRLASLGQRIIVLGVTGSGKSTLASELARRIGAPYVELDAFQWEPHWTPATRENLRTRTEQAVAGDAWVVDGNYTQTRDLTWPRAQTVIWLDYPMAVILWRLLRRTLRRALRGVELWQGNRERLWPQFFTRDSLFLWALTSQPKHRRDYPLTLAQPEYAHIRLIHLRSPRATARWLAALR